MGPAKSSVILSVLCYLETLVVTPTEWETLPCSTLIIPLPVMTCKLQEVKRKPWADTVPLKAVTHIAVRLEIVC